MPLVDGGNGGSGGGSLNMLEEGQNDSELDLIHLSKVRRVNADSACVERVNVHIYTDVHLFHVHVRHSGEGLFGLSQMCKHIML